MSIPLGEQLADSKGYGPLGRRWLFAQKSKKFSCANAREELQLSDGCRRMSRSERAGTNECRVGNIKGLLLTARVGAR